MSLNLESIFEETCKITLEFMESSEPKKNDVHPISKKEKREESEKKLPIVFFLLRHCTLLHSGEKSLDHDPRSEIQDDANYDPNHVPTMSQIRKFTEFFLVCGDLAVI